jgi:hypothetical protein
VLYHCSSQQADVPKQPSLTKEDAKRLAAREEQSNRWFSDLLLMIKFEMNVA